MEENDRENSAKNGSGASSPDAFLAFRKAVRLESPLEFAVVLVVVVCLLGGAGIWLRSPGNRYFIFHGMWVQMFGHKPKPGPSGAGAPGDGGASANAGPPAAVVQSTETQSAPAAPGTIRIMRQKAVGSTNNSLPNGLEIMLLPDREMSPVAMTLKFSGEVGEIHSTAESAEALDEQTGILVSKPDTVMMEWRSPPFGPFSPLLITVFSKDPIKLQGVVSVPYHYPYEDGDLK